MLHTIDDIKAGHKGHWFDSDTLRLFSSRISSRVHPTPTGALFVSSETDGTNPRLYSVRRAIETPNGVDIVTVGEFQSFATLAQAHGSAKRMASAEWRVVERNLFVEVTECTVSATAEECRFEGDHERECDGECFSLDGDIRYVEEPSTTTHSFGDQDDEPSPQEWAVGLIDDEVASLSSDFLEPSMWPLPSRVFEHAWITGRYTNPATGHETQYSVRLTGDWLPEERSRVFRSVANLHKS